MKKITSNEITVRLGQRGLYIFFVGQATSRNCEVPKSITAQEIQIIQTETSPRLFDVNVRKKGDKKYEYTIVAKTVSLAPEVQEKLSRPVFHAWQGGWWAQWVANFPGANGIPNVDIMAPIKITEPFQRIQ